MSPEYTGRAWDTGIMERIWERLALGGGRVPFYCAVSVLQLPFPSIHSVRFISFLALPSVLVACPHCLFFYYYYFFIFLPSLKERTQEESDLVAFTALMGC